MISARDGEFACPPGGARPLTSGERNLVDTVFRGAIDLAPVTIRRRKWFAFQPRTTVMAPMGHIHFHPQSSLYRDDFSAASIGLQALFIHEMTHVWQAQQRGRWYLPLMRHPLCRYDYALRPGQPLTRYGIEQQAEIVKHAFLERCGCPVIASPGRAMLESVLPF